MHRFSTAIVFKGFMQRILPTRPGWQPFSVLAFTYINSIPDTALKMANELLGIAKKAGSIDLEIIAMNRIAYVYSNMGLPIAH
jgi:hypothetical protein